MRFLIQVICIVSAASISVYATDPWPSHLPVEYQGKPILIQTRFEPSEVPPLDLRRWTPMIQDDVIWEQEAYFIAGMMEEFQRARTFRRTTISLLVVGPIFFVLGSAVTLNSIVTGESSTFSSVIMLGSMVTFIVGLTRIGKRWSTYGEINTVAMQYNRRLNTPVIGADFP